MTVGEPQRKMYEVTVRYTDGYFITINQTEIDRMIQAKDALEMVAYALQIAKELNKLNERN